MRFLSSAENFVSSADGYEVISTGVSVATDVKPCYVIDRLFMKPDGGPGRKECPESYIHDKYSVHLGRVFEERWNRRGVSVVDKKLREILEPKPRFRSKEHWTPVEYQPLSFRNTW